MNRKQAEKETSRSLRRSTRQAGAFKRRLAEELGVEEVPQSFHDKIQETFAQLPDELRVKKKPFHIFLKGASWAMAAAAAAFVILLGLNTLSPQFTEGLPGLGAVFTEINGGHTSSLPSEPSSSLTGSNPPAEDVYRVLPLVDNGITLMDASFMDDGRLRITATIPYMGRESYSLLCYEDDTLYGSTARLAVNGNFVYSDETQAPSTEVDPSEGSDQQPDETKPCEITWYFSLKDVGDPQASPVILTLFEHPISDSLASTNRVLAEFAISLATGSAKISTAYDDEGYTKITPQTCMGTDHNSWASSPYLLTRCNPIDNGYYRVDLFCAQDALGEEVGMEFYRYSDDTPVGSLAISAMSELEAGESPLVGEPEEITQFDLYGSWFSDGQSFLWQGVTDPDRTGIVYEHDVFLVPLGEIYSIWEDSAVNEDLVDGSIRITLTGEGGQFLVKDVFQTVQENCRNAAGRGSTSP